MYTYNCYITLTKVQRLNLGSKHTLIGKSFKQKTQNRSMYVFCNLSRYPKVAIRAHNLIQSPEKISWARSWCNKGKPSLRLHVHVVLIDSHELRYESAYWKYWYLWSSPKPRDLTITDSIVRIFIQSLVMTVFVPVLYVLRHYYCFSGFEGFQPWFCCRFYHDWICVHYLVFITITIDVIVIIRGWWW